MPCINLSTVITISICSELRAISDVALNLIVADSFCLASHLTGDKAD